MRRKKSQAHLYGLEAEWLAGVYLTLKGYRILKRRFSDSGGEIDLIARRGKTLVFIEVKARKTMEEALTAISPMKLQRISRAARAYLSRLPRLPETMRCDAVFLAPNCWPRHIVAYAPLAID